MKIIELALKKSVVLSAILIALSACVNAAPVIETTCTQGLLSNYLGVSCSIGDKVFDNFTYSGNVAASSVNIDFQMVGTEFRLILAPTTGAGFFTNLNFTDRITVQPGIAPNILPAIYMITVVKDQANFSLANGSSGLLHIVNSPGPTYDLAPGSETGGPTGFAPTLSVTTTSHLSGPGGTGDANPGLSSFELGYVQTDTSVPEPATMVLMGGALIGLGLVRRRRTAAR